jgi:hypothetical protein
MGLALGKQVGAFGNKKAGKFANQAEDAMGIGDFQMMDVEKDKCSAIMAVVAQAVPTANKTCDMWRNALSASVIAAGCIIVGSLLSLVAACLLQSRSKDCGICRLLTSFGGPVVGLGGLGIYAFMTMKFPEDEMSFGVTFYVAVCVGLALLLVSGIAVTRTKSDDDDDSDSEEQRPVTGASKGHGKGYGGPPGMANQQYAEQSQFGQQYPAPGQQYQQYGAAGAPPGAYQTFGQA